MITVCSFLLTYFITFVICTTIGVHLPFTLPYSFLLLWVLIILPASTKLSQFDLINYKSKVRKKKKEKKRKLICLCKDFKNFSLVKDALLNIRTN